MNNSLSEFKVRFIPASGVNASSIRVLVKIIIEDNLQQANTAKQPTPVEAFLLNVWTEAMDRLFDIAVFLALLASVILGISAMTYNFFIGLISMLGSIVSVAVCAYIIYLVIDIRDRMADIYRLQLEQTTLAKVNQEKKTDAE